MDEQNLVIMLGHVPSVLNKLTFHHVFEVITILLQAHPVVALHVVSSVPQDGAVSLPDFICNILFHHVTCVWFVKEQSFIKIAPRKEIRRGCQAIMFAATNGHPHILHISVDTYRCLVFHNGTYICALLGSDGMQHSQGQHMRSASESV
jgi:hypothetical protein